MSIDMNARQAPALEFDVSDDQEQELEVPNLSPADKGKDAYAFLCGGFIIEAILWGMCLCDGVRNYSSFIAQASRWHSVFSKPIILGHQNSGIAQAYLSSELLQLEYSS